jgi:hypothetical protein
MESATLLAETKNFSRAHPKIPKIAAPAAKFLMDDATQARPKRVIFRFVRLGTAVCGLFLPALFRQPS